MGVGEGGRRVGELVFLMVLLFFLFFFYFFFFP